MTDIDTTQGLPVGWTIARVEVTAVRFADSQPLESRRLAQIYQRSSAWWGAPPPPEQDDEALGQRLAWDERDFPGVPIEQVSHSLLRLDVLDDHVDVTARVRPDGAFRFMHNGAFRLRPTRTDPSRWTCRLDFVTSGAEYIDVEHVTSARSLRLLVRISGIDPLPPALTNPVPAAVLDEARSLVREHWWRDGVERTKEQLKVLPAIAAWLQAHPHTSIDDDAVTNVRRALAATHKRPFDPLRNACNKLYFRSDEPWMRALRVLGLEPYLVAPEENAPGRVIHQTNAQPLELLPVLRQLIACGVLRPGVEFPVETSEVTR